MKNSTTRAPSPSPGSGTLPPAKLRAMAALAEEAALLAGGEVFLRGRPADRAMGAFVRDRRSIGGRDRRFVTETVFSMFRWWGWLRRLLPCPEAAFFATPDDAAAAPPDASARARLLLAAALADADLAAPPPAASAWAERLRLPLAGFAEFARMGDPAGRVRRILSLIGGLPAEALRFPDLAPSWLPTLLPSAIPPGTFVEWAQRRPPLWIRAQPASGAEAIAALLRTQDIVVEPHPRLPGALALRGARVNLYELPAFREGQFEIQDAASQGIGLACAPRPGERWWDACAGGGGKSLQLGALMQGRGLVLATDIRAYKLEELRRRARRANLHNLRAEPWDGSGIKRQWAKAFDGVLVDAPCSGTGTWRRNPDARWRIRPDDIAELAATQRRILALAAPAVRPGGRLVYATCSVLAKENAEVVQDFLAAHPEFCLSPFPHPLTGEATDGTVQFLPWDTDNDAMFAAVLQRAPGRDT